MAGYDTNFYDVIRAGTQASAGVLVPMLLDVLGLDAPRVIDVGCGEGWWAQTFADHGCEVTGIDGAYVQSSPLGDRFVAHDLTRPVPTALHGQYDLAISLEVAEHLPSHRAVSFVADLCALAPIVAFTAAIPGQGGTGHVNEQWPEYWAGMFRAEGFNVTGDYRYQIWNDDRIENWYRQNLIVARRDLTSDFPVTSFDAPVLPLVHPVLYDARRR